MLSTDFFEGDELTTPYIEFDMDEINELKLDYENTLEFITSELPEVNWNSRVETKSYFSDEYNVAINSLKIAELRDTISRLDEQEYFEGDRDRCKDELTGLLELLKLKYTLHNYLDCILRHHTEGRVYLRNIDGEWKMPNKQPISTNPELTRCIASNKGE